MPRRVVKKPRRKRTAGVPRTAMILAAGLGTRMRPITNRWPKPLIKVAGRAMIDRLLDHLVAAGVERCVVNLHHKADMLRQHLEQRDDIAIAFSEEPELLETGGGVAKALPLLGKDPFLVLNGDVVWFNGPTPALERLSARWEDAEMDALLLMQRTSSAFGYEGVGDFFLDPVGHPRRRREREVAPLLFAGVQILHPRLFAGAPEGAFSLNVLYDRALEAGRLYGVVHDGEWYHVGTPEALSEVHARILPARSVSDK